MYLFKPILLILFTLLSFLEIKGKGYFLQRKYFLDFLWTATLLLTVASFFQSPIHVMVTMVFDLSMVFWLVLQTLKFLNTLNGKLSLLGINGFLAVCVWIVYGVCAVREIAIAGI